MNQVNIIAGFLPSLLWLTFYLREDIKPEPKKLILIVFVLGFLSSLPALLFELFAFNWLSSFHLSEKMLNFLKFFFAVALMEEFFKFLAPLLFIFEHPEFEEPVDGMIYLITSGMGFASAENLLISLNIVSLPEILEISLLRFWGATFIHALTTGICGYFFALYYFKKRGKIQLFFGLGLATLLHGLYNFSIISIKEMWQIIFPLVIVIFSFFLLSFFFKRLKAN